MLEVVRASRDQDSYVQAALVMRYSQVLPHDCTEQEAEAYEREWEHDRKVLDEEHDPTPAQKHAANLCAARRSEHERYGLPRSGGYMDQPMNWRTCVDLAEWARMEAEKRRRFEEAENSD